MPIEFTGFLEDVEGYEGKNGFGANITVSSKVERKVKRLEFRTKSKELANKLDELLGTEVTFKIILAQNNFGLRFGDILEVA